MRRRLAAAAVVVAATAAAVVGAGVAGVAGAQSGWSGGWTDPAPTADRDGTPLAYLDRNSTLTGQVSHSSNTITDVDAIYIPNVEDPPPEGCEMEGESAQSTPGGSQSVTFTFDAEFPCNLVYEVRATARAARNGALGATPPPYVMPLLVAVAVPPEPVAQVDAVLEVDGDDRSVTLTWPAGQEPDLLGYVVTRVVDGDRETLGQVDADDDTEVVDADPPKGETATYEVTAVRRGPDDEVEQVSASPTTVDVDVPADAPTEEGGGETSGEAPLTTVVTGAPEQGRPDPGSLSSVRARGPRPAPPTPTTIDSGFQETLPFEPPAADEVAVPPPTGDAAVVATFDTSDESMFGSKDAMAMVAGGLALFVGALVIVYITRRAAVLGY